MSQGTNRNFNDDKKYYDMEKYLRQYYPNIYMHLYQLEMYENLKFYGFISGGFETTRMSKHILTHALLTDECGMPLFKKIIRFFKDHTNLAKILVELLNDSTIDPKKLCLFLKD